MTDITCVKSINGSSIDVLWTNKIESFHHTAAFESGLSDFQKTTLTFFSAYFKKITHKNIEHRNFKPFTKMVFSMNFILNLAKELYINIKITSLTS